MRTVLVVALLLLFADAAAKAAELLADPVDGRSTGATWDGRYPYSFTQNADPFTFDAGVYTCGNTLTNYVTDSWAMRRFFFADEGISVPFTVQSIDWGVHRFVALSDSTPGPYEITLYVGTIGAGLPLEFANVDWVNSVPVPLTIAVNGDVFEFVTGACCLASPHGTCVMMLREDCVQPNLWMGGSCDPNPCWGLPVEEASWGRIKATYR